MSRIMLLVVIVLWMCRSAAPRRLFPLDASSGATLFVGGLLLVVLFLGLWSRTVAHHLRGANLHRSLRRFHTSIVVARVLIPVWFAIAVFLLGWGQMVDDLLKPIAHWPVELPSLFIGTLPAFAAWVALWWAQFPADRALREQTQLVNYNEDLPIHAPPNFWSYFISHLRLQLLFTVVPVALIVLLHDVAAMLLLQLAGLDLRAAGYKPNSTEGYAELLLQLASIGLVVLFAPEVLRRVLHTQSLPSSPLRHRLEELCRRTGLKYRDILLWRTDHNMGNAAVMGVVPQMRYILLSDVLLETMTDYQIEAVFAHEIGHVKHWHMGWYAILIATLVLLCFGPGQIIGAQLERMLRSEWVVGMGTFAAIGLFFLVFGYLSRWFERQADVFAARTIQQQNGAGVVAVHADPDDPTTVFEAHGWAMANPRPRHEPRSYVGPVGAAAFTSALHRVAAVNNIPTAARNFTHGSIEDRVHYLNSLSADPTRTHEFDRWMSVLYIGLVMALIICSAWVMVTWLNQPLRG